MKVQLKFFLIFFSIVGITFSAFSLELLDQARLWLEKGELEKAINVLEPLLTTPDPDPKEAGEAVEILYQVYSQLGEDEKALAALNWYVQKFPNTPSAFLYQYWMAKIEEERHNFDQALSLLSEIALNYPPEMEDPFQIRLQAWEDIAHNLHYYQKRYEEALGVYQNILLNYSTDQYQSSRIMMEIGACYERLGEIDRAISTYKEVIEKSPSPYYDRWAQLRIEYLQNPPARTRETLEDLGKDLRAAFQQKDMQAVKDLAKKGDFWVGQIYSEFDIQDFSAVEEYIAQYLAISPVELGELEKKDGSYYLKIFNWADPDFDIIYLVLEEGVFGWEWKGIVLSSSEIEFNYNNQ